VLPTDEQAGPPLRAAPGGMPEDSLLWGASHAGDGPCSLSSGLRLAVRSGFGHDGNQRPSAEYHPTRPQNSLAYNSHQSSIQSRSILSHCP